MPFGNYWQREEILPLKDLYDIQAKRLRWVVKHAYDNVPFYRRKMKELNVHPSDIKRRDSSLLNLP